MRTKKSPREGAKAQRKEGKEESVVPPIETLAPLRLGARQFFALPGLVFAASLSLFVLTLAPSVGLTDSGELTLAAYSLGNAHPPGFPLYVLLAHAATWIPFGNVAQRVNLLSAVCAALGAGLLAIVVQQTSRSLRSSEPIAACIAALAFASSRTFWSYATVAEVYTLNFALIMCVFVLVLAWRRERRPWLLYVAALGFGLGLCVHHVTVLLTLPALLYLVLANAGVGFLRTREFAIALFALCLGLAVYAYLPLAATREPVINWGDPRTLQRLWWHVSGRQYHSYFTFTLSGVASEAGEFAQRLLHEFGPPRFPAILGLSAGGLVVLFRGDRQLFVTLILVVVCNLAYSLGYDIAEDQDAYQLPTFAVGAITAGVGVHYLLARMRAHHSRLRTAVSITCAALPLIPLVANLPFNNRRNDYVARDYAGNIEKTIAPGGMLLTLDWQVYAPLLYVRHIEHVRSDVIAIDINQLRRSWYFDYLRRQYPALIEATRSEVDLFVADLEHWEQDSQLYARDAALNRRIDDRFYEMILAFIGYQLRSGPLYVTQEIVVNRSGQDQRLTKALSDTYQLVPQGLVFQAFTDRTYHEPATPDLSLRGLADGSMLFAPDSVVQMKVLPVYRTMLFNRGRYLDLHGKKEQAKQAFEAALKIDPTFDAARRMLVEQH